MVELERLEEERGGGKEGSRKSQMRPSDDFQATIFHSVSWGYNEYM